jgi:hypothetical protein
MEKPWEVFTKDASRKLEIGEEFITVARPVETATGFVVRVIRGQYTGKAEGHDDKSYKLPTLVEADKKFEECCNDALEEGFQAYFLPFVVLW